MAKLQSYTFLKIVAQGIEPQNGASQPRLNRISEAGNNQQNYNLLPLSSPF
jgi:hypothetical protein